ncbi:MAG: DUF2267 domain-containing protein [Balneolaceae bacterium]|nr:DUF2267 domain-containing protein [Balneolaceae bacterium]
MNTKVHFDRQCKETLMWVYDVVERTSCPEREDWAFNALRAVLHAIRDRTTLEEAFHLSAQLPVLLRGYFFEGYRPSGKREKMNAEQFLDRIRKELGPSNELSAEEALSSVLGVLHEHVSIGELDDVKQSMPKDIANLWDKEIQNAAVW